jgi:hypothetical protein
VDRWSSLRRTSISIIVRNGQGEEQRYTEGILSQ